MKKSFSNNNNFPIFIGPKKFQFMFEISFLDHIIYLNLLLRPLLCPQKIEKPFLTAVETTLGDRYTENVENIYKITIKFIIETLIKGYDNANATTWKTTDWRTSPSLLCTLENIYKHIKQHTVNYCEPTHEWVDGRKNGS